MLRSLHHHPPGLAMADIESILSQYSQTLPTHQIGHEKKCCATQGSAAPLKSDQSSIKGNNVKSPAPDAHLAEDKRTAEDDAEQCDVGTLGLIPPKTAVTQGRTHSPASPRCGRLDWCLKTRDNAINSKSSRSWGTQSSAAECRAPHPPSTARSEPFPAFKNVTNAGSTVDAESQDITSSSAESDSLTINQKKAAWRHIPVGAVGDAVDSDSFQMRQAVRGLEVYFLEYRDRVEELFAASRQRIIVDRRAALRQAEALNRALIEGEWFEVVHSKASALSTLYRERQVAAALLKASQAAAVHRKYSILADRERAKGVAEEELQRQRGIEAHSRHQAEEALLRPKAVTMRRRMWEAIRGIRAAFAYIVCEESRERLSLLSKDEPRERCTDIEEPAARETVELQEASVRTAVLDLEANLLMTELQKYRRGQLKAKKKAAQIKKMQAEIIRNCKHNRGKSAFAGPKPAKSCIFCKIKLDPITKLLVPF